jgi:hypothetical protein
MLVLNPASVKFGAAAWYDVTDVSVDRAAARTLVEWTDTGPHAVFADVPEERVTIRVSRRLLRDTAFALRPGDAAELVVYTSATAGDAARRRLRASCVVTAVSHDVSTRNGAVQTVTLVAVSSNGSSDPLVIEDASDGAF